MGTAAERLGKNQEAIDRYRKALVLQPNAANAHGYLGIVLDRVGDLSGAKQEYLSALAIRPELTILRERLAYLLSIQGESAQAIEHYQTALEQNPQNNESRLNLVHNLLASYRPKRAQAELQSLKRNSKNETERLWARALLQQGQIEVATSHVLPAEQNGDPEFCAWIGEACAARDELDRAGRWLARSIQLKPRSAWARALRAYVRKRQNLDTAAAYDTADQSDPAWRDHMRRCGRDLVTRQSPDESLPKVALLLARVVIDADQSPQPEDLDTLAAALAQCGRFDEAIKYEEEAITRARTPQREVMRERLEAYQRHELGVTPSSSIKPVQLAPAATGPAPPR
jgi:tetratricopeptide (TPR) repeat protein